MENDHTKLLTGILSSLASITPQAIQMIADSGSVQSYPKQEIIFKEGKYNAFEFFQLSGISHRFNINEDNLPITTGIYAGGAVVTPNFARTKNNKSIFSLEALTDCVFLKVPVGAFDLLRKENSEIWSLGQRIVESEFMRHMQFEVLFRSCSAKERLLYFRTNFRLLENQIPHTVIASFLGITPVSLSRLRNELLREKE